MKNRLRKRILCVAAAAFLSHSLLLQTAVCAAAGQQMLKTGNETENPVIRGYPQIPEDPDESADPQIPEGSDGYTDSKKPEGSDGYTDSKKPEGSDGYTDSREPERSDEPTGSQNTKDTNTSADAQDRKDTDASADPEDTKDADASADPEDTEGCDASADAPDTKDTDASADPEDTKDANTPADAPDTKDADASADAPEPAEPAGSKTPKDPDKGKPEKTKLGKPVLVASSKPNGTVRLSWNKVSGAAEYVLLCSTNKDSGFHRIFTSKKATSYKDRNRVPGKVYYYQLAVFSDGRASRKNSKTVSGRSLEKAELTKISNVSGSGNLVLTWNPVTGADGYQILRKNAATGKYEEAGSVKGTKTTYTDQGRNGGTIYSYKIYAKDACGGRGNYSKAMSQMAIDSSKKMIALTYDDGPSAYTPVVLDALAKYNGHATFFVVGSSVDRYADSLRRAVALGCEIGNHTYNHSNLKNLSTVQIQSVLQATNQAVKKQTGADVQLLRPPYGSYNTATSAAAGMPLILWSVDTLDWKTRSTSATIQCVQQKAYDGAIILMHDLHQPTAMAADAVMKSLTDAGYQLVTVSELAAYRGGLRTGTAYSQFRRS